MKEAMEEQKVQGPTRKIRCVHNSSQLQAGLEVCVYVWEGGIKMNGAGTLKTRKQAKTALLLSIQAVPHQLLSLTSKNLYQLSPPPPLPDPIAVLKH